jgi:hypothetical protein
MNKYLVKTISLKGSPKRYYTGFVDKKQHIYTFANEEAADECVFFLAHYKSRYGEFPEINKPDSEFVSLKKELKTKGSILSIVQDEIRIESCYIEDLFEYITVSDLMILLVYTFDFKLNNSNKIDVSFSAESITPAKEEIDCKKYLTDLYETY